MYRGGHNFKCGVKENDTFSCKNIKTEKFDILTDVGVYAVIPKLENFETGRVEEVFCREETTNENPYTADNGNKTDRKTEFDSLKNEQMVDVKRSKKREAAQILHTKTSKGHIQQRKKSRGTFRHAIKTIGQVENSPVFPNSPQFFSRMTANRTLHIQNLSRPFTIGALKKVLRKTGEIFDESLWLDKLRTQCFVTYMDLKAAVSARQILHGARWPPFNTKKLVVEFFSSNFSFDLERIEDEKNYNKIHSGTKKQILKSLKSSTSETPNRKSTLNRRYRLSSVSDTPTRHWKRDSNHRLCSDNAKGTSMDASSSITREGRVWVRQEQDSDEEHIQNKKLKSVVGYCYIKQRKLDQTWFKSDKRQTIYAVERGSNDNISGNRKQMCNSEKSFETENKRQNKNVQMNRKLKHLEMSKFKTNDHKISRTVRELCLSFSSILRTGKAKQSTKPHTPPLNLTPMLKRLRLKSLKRPLFESTPICKKNDKSEKIKSKYTKDNLKRYEDNYQMLTRNSDVVNQTKHSQVKYGVDQREEVEISCITNELPVLNIKHEVTMDTLLEDGNLYKRVQQIKQEPRETRKPDVQLRIPPIPSLSSAGNEKAVISHGEEFNNSFIEMAY